MNLLRQRPLVAIATLLFVLSALLVACAPDPTNAIITPDLGPQMVAAAQSDLAAAEPEEEGPPPTLAELSEEEIFAGLDPDLASAIQAADATAGETVALANGCIGCHALDPAAQMTGPTWYNLGNTAVTRIEGVSPAAYLYESIVATNDYIVDGYPQGVMPQNYGDTLSADDLNTLVAYLLAQQQETE